MQLLDDTSVEKAPVLINVASVRLRVAPEEFAQLCRDNPERSLELTKDGELEIMPPVGAASGRRESKLITRLNNWSEQTGLGETFSSSTIFILPNGAKKSPAVAWVERSRWESFTPEQQEQFLPLAPDLAIELRSPSDRLAKLQQKMVEYRDNGVRLGWLINPPERTIEIYRPGREVEVLTEPETLSGEDVLIGFTLSLSEIF